MTQLNLLTDPFIRVCDANGEKKLVSLDGLREEGLQLDYDFAAWNQGIEHFLIAMLQYMVPPETNEEWEDLILERPDLTEKLAPHIKDFNFFGDGVRALQTVPENREYATREKWKEALSPHALGSCVAADKYGLDYPGKQRPWGLGDDVDYHMSLEVPDVIAHIAALDHMSLGSNAYGRGSGTRNTNAEVNFTIQGRDLWETVTSNLLLRSEMDELWGHKKTLDFTLPWIKPPKLRALYSKKGKWDSMALHTADHHPLLGILVPWREYLVPDPDENGLIHFIYISPAQDELYKRERDENGGSGNAIKYEGLWIRPQNATIPTYSKGKQDGERILQAPQDDTLGTSAWKAIYLDPHTPGVPVLRHLAARMPDLDYIYDVWSTGVPRVRVTALHAKQGIIRGRTDTTIPLLFGKNAAAVRDALSHTLESIREMDWYLDATAERLGLYKKVGGQKTKTRLLTPLDLLMSKHLDTLVLGVRRANDVDTYTEEVLPRFNRALADTVVEQFNKHLSHVKHPYDFVVGQYSGTTSSYLERVKLSDTIAQKLGITYQTKKDAMHRQIYARKDEFLPMLYKHWMTLHHVRGADRQALLAARSLEATKVIPFYIKVLTIIESVFGEDKVDTDRIALMAKAMARVAPEDFRGKAKVARCMASGKRILEHRFHQLLSHRKPEGVWREMLTCLSMLEGTGGSREDLILSLLTWDQDTKDEWTRAYFKMQTQEEEGLAKTA